MPTVGERLKQVTPKIERAKGHVSDLEKEARRFLDSKPYGIGAKHDPQTRQLVYYVSRVTPTPDSLALIAGDAIQNLMTALDHLAYQLVCSDTRDQPPNPRWIYFPIRDSFQKYEADKRGKMQGAADDTFAAIDLLKPYKGGNDLLWTLFSLNNVEKHRLLLTVGSRVGGVDLMPTMLHGNSSFPPEAREMFEKTTIFVTPADTGFPLKEGFELLIGAVEQKPDPKQQFRFEVALHEPGIVDGEPLLETLHQFATLVDGIVTALTPRLK